MVDFLPESPETEVPPSPSDVEYLLVYLRTHDAMCPLCRYNLRNLTVPRCPECGREIRLSVGLKEPYLRAMVMLLVAVCLSAGGGLLSLFVVLGELIRWGHLPEFGVHEWAIGFMIYGTILSLVPAACSIVMYRRVLRLDGSAQYVMAVAAIMWDALLAFLLLGLILDIF
jgi:hypothetical protein